ncbi:carbon catabolit repression protein [Streptomyces thioluteus]|uniref:Carbon catabolit repression protein n=1 Tax=Streptomyces thioluteus TaxID=66431 RepID=A0ABP6JEE9_STRTU
MNDATERPAPHGEPDPDAWETACAEDLAAERARRREQYGQGATPGTAAEELRKLIDAVTDKVAGLQLPPSVTAAQGAVQQIVDAAKAVVEPVVERNPEVFDHLASAGSELLAAYRAAVRGQEERWTRRAAEDGRDGRDGDDGDAPGGTERIDLD